MRTGEFSITSTELLLPLSSADICVFISTLVESTTGGELRATTTATRGFLVSPTRHKLKLEAMSMLILFDRCSASRAISSMSSTPLLFSGNCKLRSLLARPLRFISSIMKRLILNTFSDKT